MDNWKKLIKKIGPMSQLYNQSICNGKNGLYFRYEILKWQVSHITQNGFVSLNVLCNSNLIEKDLCNCCSWDQNRSWNMAYFRFCSLEFILRTVNPDKSNHFILWRQLHVGPLFELLSIRVFAGPWKPGKSLNFKMKIVF